MEQRASLAYQSSVSSAGSKQKKRKAAVRKESADTQEYEAYQQNDMHGAVSDSAGWHAPKFRCDKHDGKPHTMNFCLNCFDPKEKDRREPAISGWQWKILVSDENF